MAAGHKPLSDARAMLPVPMMVTFIRISSSPDPAGSSTSPTSRSPYTDRACP
jgi:hypothetical protein